MTLNLTASIQATEGTAPQLQVPETVSVPANGSAPVTVTFDTTWPRTWYQGSITATAGDLQLHNAVAAYLKPNRYKLTANVVLPAGATDVRYNTWNFMRLDDLASRTSSCTWATTWTCGWTTRCRPDAHMRSRSAAITTPT